jgi:uncharacterized protein
MANANADRRNGTLPPVDTIDLRRIYLRPGEVRDARVDLDLEPFLLGGQRYGVSPPTVPAEVRISQVAGARMFDLALRAHVVGPCMRCLSFAEVDVDVTAREFHDPDAAPGDELGSEYVVEELLRVGTWARDAIALEIPDKILCRPECAGLCPVCGKDLNVEPHEHADLETDPRWAALEQLRDEL